MQKESSGQGADSVYKTNWLYFMKMDFIRGQFQTWPSSGNTKDMNREMKTLQWNHR